MINIEQQFNDALVILEKYRIPTEQNGKELELSERIELLVEKCEWFAVDAINDALDWNYGRESDMKYIDNYKDNVLNKEMDWL